MAFEFSRSNSLTHEKEPFPGTWSLPSKQSRLAQLSPDTHFLFDLPCESSLWSESPHSSPLESSTETETESDEDDDFIAELAEQIAHSMLDDDDARSSEKHGNINGDGVCGPPVMRSPLDSNAIKTSISPQSSWSTNSWSASWSGSTSSSKNSSQVSSPPSTPSNLDNNAWDLLHAAAGEVGRLKINKDRIDNHQVAHASRQSMAPTTGVAPSASPRPLPSEWKQQSAGWKPQPHLVPLLSLPNQSTLPPCLGSPSESSSFTHLPKDRMAPSAPTQSQRHGDRTREEDRRPCSLNSQPHYRQVKSGAGWNHRQNRPSHPQKGGYYQKGGRTYQTSSRMGGKTTDAHGPQWGGGVGGNGGSGMRAVFLGAGGSGRESGGTGVFLPRCIGSAADYRRKPACSTVLLPSRIVQVLNLNVEDMRSQPCPAASLHSRSDYGSSGHTPPMVSYMMGFQSQSSNVQSTGSKYQGEEGFSNNARKSSTAHYLRQPVPAEFSLPTEWTY